MFVELSMLVALVAGAYLVGLITIPVIALIILKYPSRLHANTRSNSSYTSKQRTRTYRR